MMLDATQNFQEPLNAERLFAWHASLFPTGRNKMQKITVGVWRTAEAGPIGKEKVHFEAPAAEKMDAEMAQFLEWFAKNDRVDLVLKAGVAHFYFVTIHPFEDGNGRIGRAIMDLALARAEASAERFYSMSAQIESERQDYYLQLERSQRGHADITTWLEWYLKCLGRAIGESEQLLATVLRKARLWEKINEAPVNERQRKVINRLLDGFEGKLSSSKYAKLAKCSTDTALRDIKAFVERGIFIQDEGGGRSTSYRLASAEERT